MKRLLLMLLLPITVAVAQDSSRGGKIVKLAEDLHEKGWVFADGHVDVEGDITYWAVPAEQLARSIQWDGNGKVPLDLDKAISIARELLSKQHPGQDSIPLWSARIQQIESKTYANRWCHVLEFRIATKSTHQIDRAVLGAIKINGREPEQPEKAQVERTQYTYPQVYVMLDGSIIVSQSMTKESANKASEATSELAPGAGSSSPQG